MRFLIDEMLPSGLAARLVGRGHDAVSVHDANLAGGADEEIFSFAVAQRRVIVTENFGDYTILLESQLSRDEPCVPVVFVRKSDFPARGAMAEHLAAHLDVWATAHPEPYVGPHWP